MPLLIDPGLEPLALLTVSPNYTIGAVFVGMFCALMYVLCYILST